LVAAKRRWLAAARVWQKRLLLKGWEITYVYQDEEPEDARRPSDGSDWEWSATTHSRPEYLTAQITVNSAFLASASDEEMGVLAKHELLHVVMARLYHWAQEACAAMGEKQGAAFGAWFNEADEFTVTHLERILGSG